MKTIGKDRWSILALALAAAFLAVDRLWVSPLERAVAVEQEFLDDQARSRGRGLGQEVAGDQNAGQAIDQFVARLTSEAGGLDWVATAHALASDRQLRTGEVHYDRRVSHSLALHEQLVRLPLTGNFNQIHGFLVDLSERFSTLTIDRVRVVPARQGIGELEATFDLVAIDPDQPAARKEGQ